MSDPWVTTLICYHARRVTYRVEDAACQVCRLCLSVRSVITGLWHAEVRLLHSNGVMTDIDGREIHDNWPVVLRWEPA